MIDLQIHSSIKNKLNIASTKEKVEIANIISMSYKSSSFDSALRYANMSVQLASKLNDIEVIGNSMLNLGNILYLKGEANNSLSVYNKAIDLIENENEQILIKLLQGKANVLVNLGDYNAALSSYNMIYLKWFLKA